MNHINKKKGLEMEFHVVDKSGNLYYSSFDLLSHLPWVHKEIGLSMVEIVTDPHDNLFSLSNDIFSKVGEVSRILQEHELFLCPTSKLGSEPVVMRTDDRYMVQKTILGDKLEIAAEVCGTHIHTDISSDPESLIKHFNILVALDPFFSLLTSSPYYRNHFYNNNSRIQMYRNNLYQDFPELGQLNSYMFSNVQESFNSNNLKLEDVSELCTMTQTQTWAPVRMTSFSIESRSCDTNLPSLALAFAALMQGIERGVDKFILPEHSFLKYCEEVGSREGLSNAFLCKYLSETISFAEKFLSKNEIKLLVPFKHMLKTKKTFANRLSLKCKNSREITPLDVCNMRVYAAKCLLKDVKNYSLCG